LTGFLPTQPTPIQYHAVTGHLSLQGIDPTCQFICPLSAHGTLDASATGPSEETFALTSAVFVANDTVSEQERCQD